MRAKISRIEVIKETSADYSQRMYKFQCNVGDKVFEEIKTYNQMLDWVDRDLHKDDMFAFESIKAHRLHPNPLGEKGMGMDNAARGSYQLLSNGHQGRPRGSTGRSYSTTTQCQLLCMQRGMDY